MIDPTDPKIIAAGPAAGWLLQCLVWYTAKHSLWRRGLTREEVSAIIEMSKIRDLKNLQKNGKKIVKNLHENGEKMEFYPSHSPSDSDFSKALISDMREKKLVKIDGNYLKIIGYSKYRQYSNTSIHGSNNAIKQGKSTPWPASFFWNENHQKLAHELHVDIDLTFREFRDSCMAHGRCYIDWNAAFRVWLENTQKYGAPKTSPERQKLKDELESIQRWIEVKGPIANDEMRQKKAARKEEIQRALR